MKPRSTEEAGSRSKCVFRALVPALRVGLFIQEVNKHDVRTSCGQSSRPQVLWSPRIWSPGQVCSGAV